MNEKCVCSLIRINGFDEKGNFDISQGVPLLTKTFDSINEAAKYVEEVCYKFVDQEAKETGFSKMTLQAQPEKRCM